tara:strand:- start:605 stop:982 length:378 start_codon:yes stop_codon:yes gene_type:complete
MLPFEKFGTSGSKNGTRTDCKGCCSRRGKVVRDLKKIHERPSKDYACPICKKQQEEFTKSFSLDHNHSTGQFRGWLCHNCNTALGLFCDDTNVLQKAMNYLNKTENKKPRNLMSKVINCLRNKND